MAYVDSKHFVHVQYEYEYVQTDTAEPSSQQVNKPQHHTGATRGLHQFSTEIQQLAQHVSNCIAMSSGNITH